MLSAILRSDVAIDVTTEGILKELEQSEKTQAQKKQIKTEVVI